MRTPFDSIVFCTGHSRGEEQALDCLSSSVDCVFIPSVILVWIRVTVDCCKAVVHWGLLSTCDITNEHRLMQVLAEVVSNQLGKSVCYQTIERRSDRQMLDCGCHLGSLIHTWTADMGAAESREIGLNLQTT
jgi:hypothetical protein